MYSIKSTFIRGTQWVTRFAALPLLGSIPTLRNAAGASEKKIQVPAGLKWEEVSADGVRCEWLTPPYAPDDAVLFYLHGGGGVLGLYNSSRKMTGHIALACKLRTLTVDYRLAPEYPFPAGLNDCVAAYRWLLSQGVSPKRIVIAGDSMGGCLSLAVMLRIRDSRQPLPAAAALLSPNTDGTLSSQSVKTNAWCDALLSPQFARTMLVHYVGANNPKDPFISPLYADLHGLPPILIQAGEYEILLDDSTRFSDSAHTAGVDLTLEVWPRMWHDWQSCVPELPEANQAIERIAEFTNGYI
jgi:epsilon-lactone hydrolase